MTRKVRQRLLKVDPSVQSRWSKHVLDWQPCIECSLGSTCTHHVLARGRLPADVLLVGEAPGTVEDALGFPFVGPSGQLLDEVLLDTLDARKVTYCITNVVACIPLKESELSHGEVRQPTAKEMKACRPRLLDLLDFCKPKAIVYIGKVSVTNRLPNHTTSKTYRPVSEYQRIKDQLTITSRRITRDVPHPAYCLRLTGMDRQLEEKKIKLALLEICDALER